jgi:PAS domain S-box-containing protein
MIWTYDSFGVLNYVNAAWILYTGLNLAETVAQPTLWTPLLAAEEHESFAESLKSAMMNSKSFRHEAKLRHGLKAGEGRWHTVNVDPIFDADGSISSWIGTAVGLEDHKRALLKCKMSISES